MLTHPVSVLKSLARPPYHRFIRPHLPRKFGVLNGVAARHPRLFDSADIFPDYEKVLVDAMGEQIRPGDHVVIIGGGFGVSTTHASRKTGAEGRVTTYEASDERYQLLLETIEVNDTPAPVTAVHSLVGTDVAVAGSHNKADVISAGDLPDCDVLVMDCEGAEVEIIPDLQCTPRSVIVETHGCYDAPTEMCRQILASNNYKVIDSKIDSPEYGIDILTAVPENSETQ